MLDCAEESLALGASLLAAEGALTSMGLIGQRVSFRCARSSAARNRISGRSGNYNDLTEVLSLAGEGLIKHTAVPVKLEDINDNPASLVRGDVVGRLAIVYD